MRICAVELKGNDAIICIMSKNMGLLEIPECRQRKFSITATNTENMRWFQRAFLQLTRDYKVDKVVIKERPTSGKFMGGAVGFKLEAALQLIEDLDVELVTGARIKEQLKHTPLLMDYKQNHLKQFQEHAFVTAYAALHMDGKYGSLSGISTKQGYTPAKPPAEAAKADSKGAILQEKEAKENAVKKPVVKKAEEQKPDTKKAESTPKNKDIWG